MIRNIGELIIGDCIFYVIVRLNVFMLVFVFIVTEGQEDNFGTSEMPVKECAQKTESQSKIKMRYAC